MAERSNAVALLEERPHSHDVEVWEQARVIELASMKCGAALEAYRRFIACRAHHPTKSAAFDLLPAISGLAASCAPPPASPVATEKAPASLTFAPPAACAAEYRALLDVADLARRYGQSAGIFSDPLGDMFDERDQCLTAARGDAWPPNASLTPIRTDGASEQGPASSEHTQDHASRIRPYVDSWVCFEGGTGLGN